jgi:GntR family transcriptional regulator
MLLTLEIESEKPLYVQIRDQIIEGLATGELQNGESLPSTRQLAMDFGINFHTVNKAYDILRQEGILRLNRKTGAVVYVSEAGEEFAADWSGRLRTLLAEAFVKGMTKSELAKQCQSVIESFEEKEKCSK